MPSGRMLPALFFPCCFSLRKEIGSEDVRLLHLVMNWRPSLTNSRGISRNSLAWSIAAGVCGVCGMCVVWGSCVYSVVSLCWCGFWRELVWRVWFVVVWCR